MRQIEGKYQRIAQSVEIALCAKYGNWIVRILSTIVASCFKMKANESILPLNIGCVVGVPVHVVIYLYL